MLRDLLGAVWSRNSPRARVIRLRALLVVSIITTSLLRRLAIELVDVLPHPSHAHSSSSTCSSVRFGLTVPIQEWL